MGKTPKKKLSSSSPPVRRPASRSLANPRREPEMTAADDDGDVADCQLLLAKAAARFPNFISETAFSGVISGTETSHTQGNLARVWLSEDAMNASSLKPGSLVSLL